MILGKSPDLVIIGHIAYDQTVDYKPRISPRLERGASAGLVAGRSPAFRGEVSSPFPSGAAYFSGLAASLFNKNVGLVSLVGEDYDLKLLTRLGIDLEGVRQVENGRTTRFCVVYKKPDNCVRELRAELNVSEGLSPVDIPFSYLDVGHFHIAAMPPLQQRPFVEFIKGKLRARLSLDTIEQFVQESPEEVVGNLEEADLVFLNSQEHRMLMERNFLHRLRNKEIILKRGPEGASYIKGGKEVVRIPAPRVEAIVDKSGSGDVLAGVFLALFIRGVRREVALQEAVRVASASLEGQGVEALLTNLRGFC